MSLLLYYWLLKLRLLNIVQFKFFDIETFCTVINNKLMILQIEFMAKVVTWVVQREVVEVDLEDILQCHIVVPVAMKILIILSILERWHLLLTRKPGNDDSNQYLLFLMFKTLYFIFISFNSKKKFIFILIEIFFLFFLFLYFISSNFYNLFINCFQLLTTLFINPSNCWWIY